MKLDETNKAIIRQLADGRRSFSAIADEIGITENTVRARVSKLIEDNILQITGLVDPQKIPEMQVELMGVKLNALNLEEKAKEFLKLKGVISAVVVTGRYDIILQIVTSTDDDHNLLNFFKKELSKVKDVASVETFVAYQSHNYWIPYKF